MHAASSIRVIIAAAGHAVRFGGIPKELLPLGVADTPLQRAVALGRRLGEVVVITNPEKASLHRRVLEGVELKRQGPRPELWGAIRTGLQRGRPGALIMADTVTDFRRFEMTHPLMFGTFTTRESHRFSVLGARAIATKKRLVGPRQAWGVVSWSAEVSDFFMTLEVSHYDRAFEAAIRRFGYGTFALKHYADLGTFEAYRQYLAAGAR